MAAIKPFKGVLYNSEVVGDFYKVMAPPYDVISQKMQEEYYSLHQNNVVRLTLGKTGPRDSKSDNRYTRAKGYFSDWLKNNVLVQDKTPSIYIYQQKYFINNEQKTRLGFISLLEIEDPHKSCVLPHEYTFSKPKKDRLNLVKAAEANLSPIFSLFDDKGSLIIDILKKHIQDKPLIDIEEEGIMHSLWRMNDADGIKKITRLMKDKQIFIADGHHRYEVSLNYRDWMRKRCKKASGLKDYDYIMVYFSDLRPEALTILSTHRAIRSAVKFDFHKSISKLAEYFDIENFKDKDGMFARIADAKKGEFAFGLHYKNKGFFSLFLKKDPRIDDILAEGQAFEWKWLDVSILHNLIFDHILKIKEKVEKRDNIVYTRNTNYALSLVDKEGYEMAFFLNPPKLEQVKDVASNHKKMPRKSTYFYPKQLSGLVFYKMENKNG